VVLKRDYSYELNPINLLIIQINLIFGIPLLSLGLVFLFRRIYQDRQEFNQFLRENYRALKIQPYLVEGIVGLNQFVKKIYKHLNRLNLTEKGEQYLKEFQATLVHDGHNVKEFLKRRKLLINYYRKTTQEIVQDVIHKIPIEDWEVERLIHEAGFDEYHILAHYFGQTHPLVLKIQKKFHIKNPDSKKLIL
jgi:hypothetical protein